MPEACVVAVIATFHFGQPGQRIGNALIVGRYPDFTGTGLQRAARHMQHQRLAAQRAQRLAGSREAAWRAGMATTNSVMQAVLGRLVYNGNAAAARECKRRSATQFGRSLSRRSVSATQNAAGSSARSGTA